MQPKPETMIATAMIVGPTPGKTRCTTAVATRSYGTLWMDGKGRLARYARLASRYSTMTITVPNTSAWGRVRSGFFTSPAAKVMSCHESAENNEPDCETNIATNTPKADMTPSPPASGGFP